MNIEYQPGDLLVVRRWRDGRGIWAIPKIVADVSDRQDKVGVVRAGELCLCIASHVDHVPEQGSGRYKRAGRLQLWYMIVHGETYGWVPEDVVEAA